ncbi:hypothetical protein G6M26_11455 [Agrobacterium tumefaciens]|nr:hypothetical protein [Agrobacterium tumefaciens]NTE19139.1 hypothetical protein [Agrobacterium tumefaciens]
MRQIREKTFIAISANLKKSDDYKSFISKVQKKIDDFTLYPSFNIPVKRSDGKIEMKPYKIGVQADARDKRYLKILSSISNVEELLFLSPSKLLQRYEKLKFFKLEEKDPIDNCFSHTIQALLWYSELRSGSKKMLYSFYKELGIKSCIYCNSQHTLLLKDLEKTMRLQADHYIAKSSFPTFSITLSNLYPVCNNCNHLKNDKEILYSLYYNESKDTAHDLGFELDKKSITDYCLNRNTANPENHLKLEFRDYYKGDVNQSSKLNEVLKIDKIYENHKDIIADLINKKIVYNESYLQTLTEKFGQLFKRPDGKINMQLLNQMLYGHSLEDDDINKRVFSKLIIDIKKQLDSFDFITKEKNS